MVESKIKKIKENKNNNEESLLEIYSKNDSLDFKDIVGMTCDMLLAGIDTVNNKKNNNLIFTF